MAEKDDEIDPLEAQLFKEVDEELKRDRYKQIWAKYGKYFLSGATAIVLVVAGIVWWRDHRLEVRGDEGSAYAAAATLADRGSPDAAIRAFMALAAKSDSGYKALARLHAAALRAKKGDRRGAAALYDQVAADGDADQILRDLALLLSVMTQLDTGKPAALTARLAALAKGDGPWHHSALELTALLAERSGDLKRARAIYTRLADDATAPGALRSRAKVMLEILGKS